MKSSLTLCRAQTGLPDCFREVAIYSKQGIVLARLGEGELFGEMSIVTGDHVRKTRAVATKNTTIDKIDSSLMQKKLEESDPCCAPDTDADLSSFRCE